MSKLSRPPKIISAFICDDVRIENNNKLIAIGIYSEQVVAQVFPVMLGFRICLIAKTFDQGTFKLRIRIKPPGLQQIMDMDGEINVGSQGRQTLIGGPQFGFLCTEPGTIQIDAACGANRLARILDADVIAAP